LLPPLGYMAIALTSDINLGYRHLLPMLPFLAVFTAVRLTQPQALSGVGPGRRHRSGSKVAVFLRGHAIILLLITWLFLSTLRIYPHFLAYFNPLGGGPERGWHSLVDSNLDWGQDLVGLKRWLDENHVDHVWLSYFGTARPEYYGIPFTGLDSFPPRLMNPEARPFYPHDPAPGIYAISATNLQGVLFQNHDQFAWFRDREPLAKVGYSIFIYDVAAYGRPVSLALGSVQVDEILPADYGQFGSNQVRLRWFDARESLLLPTEPDSWLVVGAAAAVDTGALAWIERLFDPVVAAGNYSLYRARPDKTGSEARDGWRPAGAATLTWTGGSSVEFLGCEWETAVPGATLQLHTVWQQSGLPQPLKIFVHLLDERGEIVSQWDGLTAQWEGWRPGDIVRQRHGLVLPPDLAPGTYHLWTGMVRPDSNERGRVTAVRLAGSEHAWQAEVNDDKIYLGRVTMP
jgi:hypothetical protein